MCREINLLAKVGMKAFDCSGAAMQHRAQSAESGGSDLLVAANLQYGEAELQAALFENVLHSNLI